MSRNGSKEPMAQTVGVLEEVFEERRRQERRWGQQDHDLPRYFAILAEEVGEAAKAIVEHEWPGARAFHRAELLAEVRQELVQVAAVAVAMVESIDRGLAQYRSPTPPHATDEAERAADAATPTEES